MRNKTLLNFLFINIIVFTSVLFSNAQYIDYGCNMESFIFADDTGPGSWVPRPGLTYEDNTDPSTFVYSDHLGIDTVFWQEGGIIVDTIIINFYPPLSPIMPYMVYDWDTVYSDFLVMSTTLTYDSTSLYMAAYNGRFSSTGSAISYSEYDTLWIFNDEYHYVQVDISERFSGYYCGSIDTLHVYLIDSIVGISNKPAQAFSGSINNLCYPNPSSGNIFIKSDIENVMIYDLHGKVVFHSNNICKDQEIRLDELAKGTYLIQYTINNSIRKEKLIIE